MSFRGFSPSFLKFLAELSDNNSRDWFQAHKQQFESEVQEPFLEFIAALGGPLKTVSPHLIADSRKSGGSAMRIYRDTRFSKDKTPYKTHMSARFLHELGKEAVAPGCFLRISPDDVVVGSGVWQPDTPSLNRIRQQIDRHQESWGKIRDQFTIEAGCGLYDGDLLKRPPRGYDANHPYVEDLKRKSFAVFWTWPAQRILQPAFLGNVVEKYQQSAPLMRFLAEALEVPF